MADSLRAHNYHIFTVSQSAHHLPQTPTPPPTKNEHIYVADIDDDRLRRPANFSWPALHNLPAADATDFASSLCHPDDAHPDLIKPLDMFVCPLVVPRTRSGACMISEHLRTLGRNYIILVPHGLASTFRSQPESAVQSHSASDLIFDGRRVHMNTRRPSQDPYPGDAGIRRPLRYQKTLACPTPTSTAISPPASTPPSPAHTACQRSPPSTTFAPT